MQRFCSQCGLSLPEDTRFKKYCGEVCRVRGIKRGIEKAKLQNKENWDIEIRDFKENNPKFIDPLTGETWWL